MSGKFGCQEIYDGCKEYVQFYKDNKRISYEEVCEFLNKYSVRIRELEKVSQDYEDIVNNFFLENMLRFPADLWDDIELELGVEFDYDSDGG